MSEARNMIPMDNIDADEKFNCRGVISAIDVVDLAKDIKEKGLLQPVIVTEYPEPVDGKQYRLIGGFRRYTAHQVNMAEEIWATVMPTMSESQAVIMNLSENLNRQDLSIMQEARAILRLRQIGLGEVETAARIAKTRGWVQIRFMLLELPNEIQREVEAGIIGQTDIRELYSILKAIGKTQCITAANKLKDAKQRGVKINIRPKNKETKKLRKKAEIMEMLEHIINSIGPCLGTRALAWTAGEIADGELLKYVKEEADLLGIAYQMPY